MRNRFFTGLRFVILTTALFCHSNGFGAEPPLPEVDVDNEDACLTKYKKFTINFGGDEQVYQNNTEKRAKFGELKGTPLWLIVKNLKITPTSPYRDASIRCINLEYKWKDKNQAVNIFTEGGDPNPERYFKSAKIQNDTIVIKNSNEYRGTEEGTIETYVMALDLETAKLKEISASSSSTSERERMKIRTLFKQDKFEEAFKLLQETEQDPSGQGLNITDILFAETARILFPKLKRMQDPKAAAALAQDYCNSLWSDFSEAKTSDELLHLRDGKELPQYLARLNDLAFYMMQAGPNPKARKILELVLADAPGRSVAHLNLADLLWQQGEKTEALKHYYVYKQQLENFRAGKKTKLPPEIAAALEKTPAFTEKERRAWLAFKVIDIDGKKYLDFEGPPLIPLPYEIQGSENYSSSFPPSFHVSVPFSVQGIPLAPKSPTSFRGTELKLVSSTLGADFLLAGVHCAGGKAFDWTKKNVFNCTPKEDQTIHGIEVKGGDLAQFDANGTPIDFTLAKDSLIAGYWMQGGKHVSTNDTLIPGAVKRFTLAKDFKNDEVYFPAGSELSFYWTIKAIPAPEDLKNNDLTVRTDGIAEIRKWKLTKTIYITKGFTVNGGYIQEDWHGPEGRFCAKGNYLGDFANPDPKRVLCHNPDKR